MNFAINSVPNEIWEHINSFIPAGELANDKVAFSLVSSYFQKRSVEVLKREKKELLQVIDSLITDLKTSRFENGKKYKGCISNLEAVRVDLAKEDASINIKSFCEKKWDICGALISISTPELNDLEKNSKIDLKSTTRDIFVQAKLVAGLEKACRDQSVLEITNSVTKLIKHGGFNTALFHLAQMKNEDRKTLGLQGLLEDLLREYVKRGRLDLFYDRYLRRHCSDIKLCCHQYNFFDLAVRPISRWTVLIEDLSEELRDTIRLKTVEVECRFDRRRKTINRALKMANAISDPTLKEEALRKIDTFKAELRRKIRRGEDPNYTSGGIILDRDDHINMNDPDPVDPPKVEVDTRVQIEKKEADRKRSFLERCIEVANRIFSSIKKAGERLFIEVKTAFFSIEKRVSLLFRSIVQRLSSS